MRMEQSWSTDSMPRWAIRMSSTKPRGSPCATAPLSSVRCDPVSTTGTVAARWRKAAPMLSSRSSGSPATAHSPRSSSGTGNSSDNGAEPRSSHARHTGAGRGMHGLDRLYPLVAPERVMNGQPDGLELRLTCARGAPRERIFRTLTEPAELATWWDRAGSPSRSAEVDEGGARPAFRPTGRRPGDRGSWRRHDVRHDHPPARAVADRDFGPKWLKGEVRRGLNVRCVQPGR